MISHRLQLFLSISNQTAYNEQLLFFLSHLPHTTRNFTTMRRFYFTLLGILSVFLLSLLCPPVALRAMWRKLPSNSLPPL